MPIESRITVAAPPERIFQIYSDVKNWNQWDPDTQSSNIDGPFQTGSTGKLTPTKGNTVPMKLVNVVANRSFTVESKIPLFRMLFEHELMDTSTGTEVMHRVSFSGLLAPILGALIGRPLRKSLPTTLALLKQLAERGPAAADVNR